MLEVELSVEDLRREQERMEKAAERVAGSVMVNAVRDSILIVQRSAKLNLPGGVGGGVDTGRLRASIVPEISVRPNVIMGIVGSNLKYAPFVEFPTRPHWPPISALEGWARRHGLNAYLVARAISRRGTKGVRYLGRAVEENMHRIQMIFNRAGGKVLE